MRRRSSKGRGNPFVGSTFEPPAKGHQWGLFQGDTLIDTAGAYGPLAGREGEVKFWDTLYQQWRVPSEDDKHGPRHHTPVRTSPFEGKQAAVGDWEDTITIGADGEVPGKTHLMDFASSSGDTYMVITTVEDGTGHWVQIGESGFGREVIDDGTGGMREAEQAIERQRARMESKGWKRTARRKQAVADGPITQAHTDALYEKAERLRRRFEESGWGESLYLWTIQSQMLANVDSDGYTLRALGLDVGEIAQWDAPLGAAALAESALIEQSRNPGRDFSIEVWDVYNAVEAFLKDLDRNFDRHVAEAEEVQREQWAHTVNPWPGLASKHKQAAPQQNLLTQELRRKLPDLYATEEVPVDQKTLWVKFFSLASDWRWYAAEFDGTDTFFGYVDGDFPEWGYFSLSEMQSARGANGVPLIERDTHFRPITFTQLQQSPHMGAATPPATNPYEPINNPFSEESGFTGLDGQPEPGERQEDDQAPVDVTQPNENRPRTEQQDSGAMQGFF